MSRHEGEHGPRKFGNLIFEVLLITVGVFLALWANSWHEESEHRSRARAALQNFLDEMQTNLQSVQQYRSYHETLVGELDTFVHQSGPATEERLYKDVHFQGMRPVIFEHTAWDLALATQALSYLKPDLAFDISKVYTQQNAFQTLEDSFLTSAFTPASLSSDNMKGLATAMVMYLREVNQKEPDIVRRYEEVIPKIKAALN